MFYSRKSDLTGDMMVSIYAPDIPYKIYDQEEWWSKKWDARDYGREFDFTRPFFDQMNDLWKEVPIVTLWNSNCENATYNNNCFHLKDSYMNYNSDEGERIMYSYGTEFCTDSADCTFVQKSELCYECTDCTRAYTCIFSSLLDNCTDCSFSSDLMGCKNCFGCHGLRQQSYCFFNEHLSKDEWEDRMKSISYTPQNISKYKKQSEEVRMKVPQVATKMVQCSDSTGNFLYNCANSENCFDMHNCEFVKNGIYVPWDVKHAQDVYAHAGAEWSYEVIAGGIGISHVAFINGLVSGLSDSYYSVQCGYGSNNLFGCVSMMKYKYCILNKQYTKEEYEELVPRVIEHMKKNGEWGEFFPPSISPFAYNETMAQEFFPLTKEEALNQGYKWRDIQDELPKSDRVISSDKLPPSIEDIPDDILNWAIKCEVSGRLYKITSQELDFYRRMKLPVPRLHYEKRYQNRAKSRPPRKLWNRKCNKCDIDIQTVYSPDRPEKVFCEDCYLKEVY
jgi:hypothetical protein